MKKSVPKKSSLHKALSRKPAKKSLRLAPKPPAKKSGVPPLADARKPKKLSPQSTLRKAELRLALRDKASIAQADTERRANLRRRAVDNLPDFRDLVENSVQGILVHRNFRPLYVNQAFAELFGYASPQEILDLPLVRPLIPSDMWARIEQEYDDLIKGRKESQITRARGLRKDGNEIWTAVTQRVIDWHGTPAIHLSAFDITHQMTIEQNLLESEQHLRAVLEILPYPIYIARRPDGQLLFVNRKTCLLFEQSAGQLLRSHSGDFFLNSADREELRQLVETISDIRDVEIAMRTATGREFVAELAAIAMDYESTPAVLVALNDISQRKELEAELFQQASTDALTGISNRRYFITQAEQELRRSRRFARDLSVMMIDLDHFKNVNDNHGHAVGDAVLQGAVKYALESLRQSDFIGRLGGEEFAVILPETDLKAAHEVAERLRAHIAERPIIAERVAVMSTVSVGVAQLNGQDTGIDALMGRADKALYRAKESGRNRVELAE